MAPVGAPDAEALRAACAELMADYDTAGWWPADSAFEIMVGAVLVQNTRWSHVSRAIEALRRSACLSPRSLARTTLGDLTGLIRSAGCQQVKARRLHALADGVLQAGSLSALARRPTVRLRTELLSWHGIGEETADAILLFAFNRPGFLGDAYARRWLSRRGLFDAGTGTGAYRRAKAFVDERLDCSAAQHQALHGAIILHCQQLCRVRPLCDSCIQAAICLYKTDN
ncbi:MAG: endonuclease III domain-containing protein [Gammaproteobacteria bacterium]